MAGSEQQASKICILALSALYYHFSVYSLATYKTKHILQLHLELHLQL